MTRNRAVFFFLSLIIVIPVVLASYVASAADGDEPGEDSLYKYLTVFTEVLSRVRQNYVDSTDLEALIAGALDGAADALDPFSVYVPGEAVETYEEVRTIGPRRTGLLVLRQQGVAFVAGVLPGSPAEEAGLELGDILAEINGESTRTLPLWEAQKAVSGLDGQPIELTIVRLNERVEATVTPAEFDLPAPSVRQEGEVGVLRIPAFSSVTLAETRRALEAAAAEGRQRLLIDLRGVTGGDPALAYEVAGLFAQGALGSLVRRDETLSTFDGSTPPVWSGRLAVLVDRGTQGAAEVLASVLRQTLGAELVGQRTFGHAGQLTSRQLSTGGMVFFTRAFYAGPDGEPLSDSLIPDERVEQRFFADEEDDSDRTLERGLEVLLEQDEQEAAAA